MRRLLVFLLVFSGLAVGACSPASISEDSRSVDVQLQSAQYVDYNVENLALAHERGRVLLFFHAAWCPTCRALEEDLLDDATSLPSDLTILRLDYDTELDLRQQYGVTLQHTLVQVDRDGNLIRKWTGGGLETIREELGGEPVELSVENAQGDETERVVNEVELSKDFSAGLVDPKELLQACPNQDCIPAIDEPIFVDAVAASEWLTDEDRVFALNHEGEFRAYPQRILNWHEIVNDEIAGDPIVVSFCPLCGSAVAFEPFVGDVATEFGVSGYLHKSDLVMYDRLEGNLWQQITGEAIAGPAANRGEVLTALPIVTTTWGEWKSAHPETLVLSLDTGYMRDYDRYPYGSYESDDRIYFGFEGLDESMPVKTVVYGVEIDGEAKAYPEALLLEQGRIEDWIGGVPVVVERQNSGEVLVTRPDTGEDVYVTRLFWFAWAAFHPDTEVYTLAEEE